MSTISIRYESHGNGRDWKRVGRYGCLFLCYEVTEWAEIEPDQDFWLCVSTEKPEDGEAWPGLYTRKMVDMYWEPVQRRVEDSLIIATVEKPKHMNWMLDFKLPAEYLGHVWVWVEVSDGE